LEEHVGAVVQAYLVVAQEEAAMADYPKLKTIDEYGRPKKHDKRAELAPIPWPKIGDTFVDSVGRTLVIIEVDLMDEIGRTSLARSTACPTRATSLSSTRSGFSTLKLSDLACRFEQVKRKNPRRTLAAVETILKMNGGGAMRVNEILEYAEHFRVDLGSRSKTPWNTVSRDISCDIKDRGNASRFRRVLPGLFRLATEFRAADCRNPLTTGPR